MERYQACLHRTVTVALWLLGLLSLFTATVTMPLVTFLADTAPWNGLIPFLSVSLAVLSDVSAEEMSHLAGVTQRHQGPVNETAFADCVRTILAQHQSAGVVSDDDLLALRNQFKESKGTKA